MFNAIPDDPRLEQLDPAQRLWMFNHWLQDQKDQAELAKHHAYLLASFSHPKEVQQMLGAGDQHVSSDEEFEESWQMVKKSQQAQDAAVKLAPSPNRKRRHFATPPQK